MRQNDKKQQRIVRTKLAELKLLTFLHVIKKYIGET